MVDLPTPPLPVTKSSLRSSSAVIGCGDGGSWGGSYPAVRLVIRCVTDATGRWVGLLRQEPKPMWRPSSGRPISK